MKSFQLSGDIFSRDTKQSVAVTGLRTTANNSETNSAKHVLSLSCDSPTTVRRSPRKQDRVLVEKAVGTMDVRAERKRLISESPTKVTFRLADRTTMSSCNAVPSTKSKTNLRSCMGSSQTSYYEGDNELKEMLENMDVDEVDRMLGGDVSGKTSPATTASVSPISTLSANTSDSTLATSTASDTDKSRKRTQSSDGDCPCRKSRLTTSQKDKCGTSDDIPSKDAGLQQCERPMTITASHRRASKSERPIPRNSIRDPGHGSAVTSTTKVAVIATEVTHPNHKATTVASSMAETSANRSQAASRVQIDNSRRSSSPTKSISTSSTTVNHADVTMFAKGIGRVAGAKLSIDETSSVSPVIIAHNEGKQILLDHRGIAKGVQYEIARGITRGWWSWDDVTEEAVEQLRGTNFEKAGKVADIIGKGSKEVLSQAVIATRQSIYAELDREHEAFLEDKGRGLGLMGPWKGKENWFGGCVQLTCKLEFDETAGKCEPPFSIRLTSFGIGKSNRAARRVTSLSLLQLKVEGIIYDENKYQQLIEYLSRDLVICGRRYVAFCSKEGKVFFVETKNDFQRKPRISMGDHLRFSYKRFVAAINPMDTNKNQAMNKWLSRWHLILSTSRPVVEFDPENIHLDMEDVYGAEDKTKTESVMTDGCGFINLTALRLIATNTNSTCPVVVQGRIAGAKGLWLLHPSPEHRSDSEPPMIWIRRSQLKIAIPHKDEWHRSLRIFDLVRLPRLTVPSGLNMQTILNMSHNGVRDGAFVTLMEFGLKKEIEALTKWDGDHVCVALAKAVEEAGGVMASRRSRATGSDARLYSYVRDESDDDNDGDDNDVGLVERDPLSGCSPSLYESARDMLLAGFTPLENGVLREKLKYILQQTTKAYLEKFHIPVVMSAEAFIAPDPYGVLEEGQIYFRCSIPVGDPTVCIDPHTFLGPVLVTRNPTRVASDIQKVTAVSHDRLLSYTDVIIFSVKGERSLASYLGGGDYDGDTVTIIAEPALVDDFRNSPHIPEPPAVRDCFEQQVQRVSEFLDMVKTWPTYRKYREVSKNVLRGLSDGKVGLYSNMHDNCVYELGYNSPIAVRFAYMFTTCLDAVKSGLRIKQEIFNEDTLRWNADRPECMQKAEESSRNQLRERVGRKLARSRELGPFILETLRKAAKKLGDQALHDFEELSKKAESATHWSRCDEDLAWPYNEMKQLAETLKSPRLAEDVEKIEVFVRTLCGQYISEVGPLFGNRNLRKNGSMESTSRSTSVTRINYEYSRKFHVGPACSLCVAPEMAARIKASYAYIYGAKKSKLGKAFGFAVANDLLCSFKSQRKGCGGGSTSRECRDFLQIYGNLVKLKTGGE